MRPDLRREKGPVPGALVSMPSPPLLPRRVARPWRTGQTRPTRRAVRAKRHAAAWRLTREARRPAWCFAGQPVRVRMSEGLGGACMAFTLNVIARLGHNVREVPGRECNIHTPLLWLHLARFCRGRSTPDFRGTDGAKFHSLCLRWARVADVWTRSEMKLQYQFENRHWPMGRDLAHLPRAPSRSQRVQAPVVVLQVKATEPIRPQASLRPCTRSAPRHRSGSCPACQPNGRPPPSLLPW